jgi:hypothetical protein
VEEVLSLLLLLVHRIFGVEEFEHVVASFVGKVGGRREPAPSTTMSVPVM